MVHPERLLLSLLRIPVKELGEVVDSNPVLFPVAQMFAAGLAMCYISATS